MLIEGFGDPLTYIIALMEVAGRKWIGLKNPVSVFPSNNNRARPSGLNIPLTVL